MSNDTPDTTATAAPATSTAGGAPEPGGTVTAVINEGVPPAGEDIHLPGGTAIPFAIAVAITMTLVGTTIGWIWTIIGGIAFIVCLGLWIRDTRREVAHLPDDLSSPTAHH